MQKLTEGGPIVWLLLVLSLFSLALIVVKTLNLRGVTSGADARAQAIETWAKGDRHAALQAMADGPSPATRVTHAAMAALNDGATPARAEATAQWKGNREVTALSRHIRLLELIAMISPLLGLLGTVLGMIQSFQELALAEGAANASLLAAGIWQALLTTAAGLLVAIPAAIAATLLGERVERAASEMETSVGQLMAAHSGG